MKTMTVREVFERYALLRGLKPRSVILYDMLLTHFSGIRPRSPTSTT
jgi:hypothetical protein